ncbi:hypothetical protein ACVIGB_000684 [Bradyrhizobium sp. USDA 4341]
MQCSLQPSVLNHIAWLIGSVMILVLGSIAPSSAQDLSAIKSTLAANQCPTTKYSHIHYDDRNCGFSGQKSCDQQYSVSSQAWQDCYHRLQLCHDQIDADNKVIDESNRIYAGCHTEQSSSGSPSSSTSSDLASRLASQQARNTNSDDARRQQDRQFSDTVQSEQEAYKATAQRDALARCAENHEQDLATCSGNTSQYYKENFPADWVRLEGNTCRTTASARRNLCQTLARGDPDSQAESQRELLQRVEMTHQNISNSLSSYLPQPEPADDSGYIYQAPSPSYSYQGRPQQAQTAPSRPSQTYVAPSRGGCTGDSTACSGGGSAPRPYVPPPQPRFISPSGAVR